MYRQNVLDRVNGEDVLTFLLKDSEFPRAVAHCLGELEACFTRLPRNDHPLRAITHARRVINEVDVLKLMENNGLHDFIDQVQIDLAGIHNQVAHTWFGYAAEPGEEARAAP
jgi:uncharacterized alpha-E superfamily protein